MTFELLQVRPEIIQALKEHNIITPTNIQRTAIPMIKSGRDTVGISKTGSGKTAAFGIPIIENIVPGGGIQTLVIAPTRELTCQIADELKKFSKYLHLHVVAVYGGVAIGPQIQSLEKGDILVGTPGRLLDHLERRTANFSKLKSIVLDEADKMVDMGFIDDIECIIAKAPKDRQIILFGATISGEIDRLKKRHMKEPIYAQVVENIEYLEQFYYNIQPHEKFSMLMHILKNDVLEDKKVMIFCSTRTMVEVVAKNLRLNGVKCEMIHGKMPQATRLSVIENFHANEQFLVASAVAARGLDIKGVSHVINYDLSKDPQEYVHRVGRTARAGESGISITLLTPQDHDVFREIIFRYEMKVKKLENPQFQRYDFNMPKQNFNKYRH